jgi:hypothetical protein
MGDAVKRSWVNSNWVGVAAFLACLSVASGCAPARSDSESPPAAVEQSASRAEAREWFVSPLTGDGTSIGSGFGHAVGLSGNTAVVAAPSARAVFVFVLTAEGWLEQARLDAPSQDGDRLFAEAVAISGDTIVVGAPHRNGRGAAYVYRRSGASWGTPVTLAADGDGVDRDWFGGAVAISGDTAVVGAQFATVVDEYSPQGAVYAFSRSGGVWTQTKKLLASDAGVGDGFGSSVALSESTVLVGAPTYFEGSSQGAAYFFTRFGTEWSLPQRVTVEPPWMDEFGHRVALTETLAVIGARTWSQRPDASVTLGATGHAVGAAFAYAKSESGWTLLGDGLFADDRQDNDWFGTAVAASGSKVMAGTPRADTVYIFDPLTNTAVIDRIGRRGLVDYFGGSIALDGDVAVIGTEVGRNGAYVAELLVPDGGACAENSDCRARFCVEGVCCNVECAGACETCASGTCTPLPDDATRRPCDGYLCTTAGGACPTTCDTHGDCVDTHYCRAGECVPREANGASCREARICASRTCTDDKCGGTLDVGSECSDSVDCSSGFCVDGYCCNEACRGQCEACDLRASRGTCLPVEGVPHGERAPCEGTGVCAGACDGEHTARCSYASGETPCGKSCSDGLLTNASCNGQGACEDREPMPCEPYICADESECGTGCVSTRDCAPGYTCSDGRCEPRSTCANDYTAESPDGTLEDCWPYRCVDGRCKKEEGCESTNDCVGGFACLEGECVPAPSKSRASTSDGGCSVGARRPPDRDS